LATIRNQEKQQIQLIETRIKRKTDSDWSKGKGKIPRGKLEVEDS
jgi:hypothetical protein